MFEPADPFMYDALAFGEEQLLKLTEEWEALPNIVKNELNLTDYQARPYAYGDLQKFVNDQMNQNMTSEDYFNLVATNLQKFISKKTEEDIDLIRKFFGFKKPEPEIEEVPTSPVANQI